MMIPTACRYDSVAVEVVEALTCSCSGVSVWATPVGHAVLGCDYSAKCVQLKWWPGRPRVTWSRLEVGSSIVSLMSGVLGRLVQVVTAFTWCFGDCDAYLWRTVLLMEVLEADAWYFISLLEAWAFCSRAAFCSVLHSFWWKCGGGRLFLAVLRAHWCSLVPCCPVHFLCYFTFRAIVILSVLFRVIVLILGGDWRLTVDDSVVLSCSDYPTVLFISGNGGDGGGVMSYYYWLEKAVVVRRRALFIEELHWPGIHSEPEEEWPILMHGICYDGRRAWPVLWPFSDCVVWCCSWSLEMLLEWPVPWPIF